MGVWPVTSAITLSDFLITKTIDYGNQSEERIPRPQRRIPKAKTEMKKKDVAEQKAGTKKIVRCY